MLTERVILLISGLLLVFAFSSAIPLFHGKARNKKLLPFLLRRLSMVLYLLLPRRSFGCISFCWTLVFPSLLRLLFMVITKVPSRLSAIQFITSEQSTLRLSFTLFAIITLLALSLFLTLPLRSRLSISSPRRTLSPVFISWLANS